MFPSVFVFKISIQTTRYVGLRYILLMQKFENVEVH